MLPTRLRQPATETPEVGGQAAFLAGEPQPPESPSFTWACAGCDRCADQRGAPPAGPPLADLARRARNELRAPAAWLQPRAPVTAAVAASERPPPLRDAGREAAADTGHEPAPVSAAGLRRRHELAPGADRGCESRRPLLLRGQRRRPVLHGLCIWM